MDESTRLSIIKRAKGGKGAMNKLRREGFLPCSMSQKGGASVSFSVKKDDFRKALGTSGMSSIYTLQADKKTAYSAMVHEIQYAPGSSDFLHVDFQRVSLTEEASAEISVHIKGRDELIHHGHELLQQLNVVHLRGLPGGFPASIVIDVSRMQPGDQVTVADLNLPEGVSCLTEPDRLVLSVPHPKLREEKPAGEQEAPEAETKPAGTSEVS